MICLTDKRLKEIEKSEYEYDYDRYKYITRQDDGSYDHISANIYLNKEHSNEDEIRGFVFGKIMSVFNNCQADRRCIKINGMIKYNYDIIKNLIKEIDPYIDNADISVNDGNVIEHGVTFIKFSKEDKWHYTEELKIFAEGKYLFEENNE